MIVVGGGPAGSSLAYRLASAGIGVAVFEKGTFPRYKTCGGGVQEKTAQLLEFPIEPAVERILTKMRVTFHMDRPVTKLDYPPVYTVTREKFDAHLAEKAKERGAQFLEGERVTGIQEEADSEVLVRTTQRLARASFVVGADGASSIVRRTLYPLLRLQHDFGLEAEVTVPVDCLEAAGDAILVDWGTLPGGYAWVFPKRGHLSIGAGGPLEIRGRIRSHFRSFLAKLEEQGVIRDYTIDRFSAHLLPMIVGKNRLNTARTLVVGDAAGLIDPFSGEGLYYAVRSGQIAADSIIRTLQGEAPDLDPYTDETSAVMSSEIGHARSLMRLFNTAPNVFHAWLRRSDRLANAMARTFNGEKSYASWRGDLGMAAFLWPAIDAVSAGAVRCRLRRIEARQHSIEAWQPTRAGGSS